MGSICTRGCCVPWHVTGFPGWLLFGRFHDTSAVSPSRFHSAGWQAPCPNLLHSILGCTYSSPSLGYMQRLGLPNYILFPSFLYTCTLNITE
jgi:hypothetical protein